MRLRKSWYLMGFVCAAAMAGTRVEAQSASTVSSPDSAMYARAQELVSNGEAEAGRKIVDSLLNAAPPGSPQRAEGLYWRATLAASAKDAEQDYRRIVVDHPLSPRVPDALLRMGELESARGDREAALQHFNRLTLEHPESPLHAEASYWLAHTYFETNDVQHGCAANAEAIALVRPANVELKNRIAFQQQRCRGVAVAQTATPVPSEKTVTSAPADSAVAIAGTVKAPKPASKATGVTRAKGGAHAMPIASARAPSRVPAAHASHAVAHAPAPVRASHTAKPAATHTATHTATPASGTFAVQVAAFGSRAQANELAVKLRGRGYSAHVDGVVAPYRVRIGSYGSHASAVAEQQRLKAKQISGFVTPE